MVQIIGIAAVLLVGLLLRPVYIFGLLETIATLAVIIIYCVANLALTAYIRREHAAHFNIWHHVVSPWIGTLALLPVLFVTMYPEPEWPYNIAPYFLLVSLMAGFGYMQWLESRRPGALLRGATMLVGSRSTSEGDVDWDKSIAPPS
jgi:amino acid transporter